MRKWQILEFDGRPYYAFVPEGDETPLPDMELPEDVEEQIFVEEDVKSETKLESMYEDDGPTYDSMDEKLYEADDNLFNNDEGKALDDAKPVTLNGSSEADIIEPISSLYHVKIVNDVYTIENFNIDEESKDDEVIQTEEALNDDEESMNVEYLEEELLSPVCENVEVKLEEKSPSSPIGCKLCSETFSSTLMYKKHVAWTHKKKVCIQEDGTYICAVCDYRTTKKTLFAAHLERKHETWSRKRSNNSVFPCMACGFVCRSKHSLQSHFIRKHTDTYEHHCDFCPKKFKVKGDLTNHIRFHHKEKPVKCDVCGKLCQNSGSLYVHQKWAHYKPKYECHICKRRMVTQENLDQHLLTQHEKREKIVCAECGKTFTKKDSFKRHMAVHTGCKPHSCVICSKPFARRSQLRQHLLIHTGKRPFVCDICGKAFTQKPGLICHRKTHPGPHPPLPVMPIADIVKEFTENYVQEMNVRENEEAIYEEDISNQ